MDCLQYACGIGDKYHDEAFYHVNDDGTETEIPYTPTQEQQMAALQADNDEMTLVMADLIGGGTDAE